MKKVFLCGIFIRRGTVYELIYTNQLKNFFYFVAVLTDIDINNYDSSIGTPSIQSTLRSTPYQFNNDIFFVSTSE